MKKIVYVEPDHEVSQDEFESMNKNRELLHFAKNDNKCHIYDTIEDFAEAFNSEHISDMGYMYITEEELPDTSKYSEHFQKAVQYVRENKGWSDAEDEVALEKIDQYRCPLDQVAEDIVDNIRDLMEEYGQDNDLEEGWWEDEADEEEIFFLLK